MLRKKSIINVDTKEASKEASLSVLRGVCPDCGYLDTFPLPPGAESALVQCKRCLIEFTVPTYETKSSKKQGE